MNTVNVKIYNDDYPIRSEEPDSKIHQIAQFVDERMGEVAKNISNREKSKIAVLAAINITGEYFKLRESLKNLHNEVDDKITQRAQQMVHKLQEVMNP